MLNRLFLYFLAFSFALTFVACGDDDDDDDPQLQVGTVQAYHAVPDAPAVQVTVDGEVAGTISFKEDLDYTDVEIGNRSFGIRLQGEATDLSSASNTVELNKMYTVFAFGEVSTDPGTQPLQLKVVEDMYDTPADGQAKVRAFHGSPDAGTVDISIEPNGAQAIVLEDVAYSDVSGFSDVAPGDYVIRLYEAGTVLPLTNELYNESFTVADGQVLTIAAVGKAGDSTVDLDVIVH